MEAARPSVVRVLVLGSLLACSLQFASATVRPFEASAQQEEISARVLARSGRVELVDESGAVHVVSPLLERRAGERAHLEVGAGSRAELVWSSLGSVIIDGPCTLEWRRTEDVLTLPGEAAHVTCVVSELGQLEFELRRGSLALEAPGGWRLALGRCALGVRGLSGGACRIELRAGEELAVEGPRDARTLWPRRALLGGEALVLDARAAPPSRPDVARHAPRWTRFDWPWGSAASEARQDPQELPESGEPPIAELDCAVSFTVHVADLEGSTFDEPAAPISPRVADDVPRFEGRAGETHEPRPSAALPGAAEPWPATPTAMGAPAPDAARDVATAPLESPPANDNSVRAPVSPPAAAPELAPRAPVAPLFHALDWRGFAWSELEAHGAWVVARREGLFCAVHDDGRITVSLAAHAPRASWCMGPEHDVELRPGATVSLLPGGGLGGHLGPVRVVAALEGRPAFTAIPEPRAP